MSGLELDGGDSVSLRVKLGELELARYVYRPWDAQLESPRPYIHPLRTLAGDVMTCYRPDDHVWHKGLAWSLPNIGRAGATPSQQQNFWGGPTYVRGMGYQQLANNGTIRHREFLRMGTTDQRAHVAHQLEWVTEGDQLWFDEIRTLSIAVHQDAWVLVTSSELTNVSDDVLLIGSPTTQGRENAGYGGLFWRGPSSFTGGAVLAPGGAGGDELMGSRAPWLGFTGQHDDGRRQSALVFVDDPGNAGHPTEWFVRSEIFGCICPAPFFGAEIGVPPGDTLRLRYAVAIADGAIGPSDAAGLATLGLTELSALGSDL